LAVAAAQIVRMTAFIVTLWFQCGS